MAYQKPLVEVYQEYAQTSVSTSSNVLYPCIVGPCFHLVSPEINKTSSFAGVLTSTGLAETNIPGNYPGAEIVTSSVQAVLTDMYALVEQGTVTAATGTSVTVSLATTQSAVGDTAKIYTSGDVFVKNAKVVSSSVVEGATVYKLSVIWPSGVTPAGCKVYIIRAIDGTKSVTPVIDALDATMTLATVTTTASNITGSKTVYSANVYAKYSALRTDLSDISTVSSTEDIKATLGKIDPANPLAYAANLALSASNVAVKVIGIEDDSFAGYSETLKTLEAAKVYAIVPLSQSSAVVSLFKNHAEQMSDPTKGLRRITIGSTLLQTEATLQTGAGTISLYEEGAGSYGE